MFKNKKSFLVVSALAFALTACVAPVNNNIPVTNLDGSQSNTLVNTSSVNNYNQQVSPEVVSPVVSSTTPSVYTPNFVIPSAEQTSTQSQDTIAIKPAVNVPVGSLPVAPYNANEATAYNSTKPVSSNSISDASNSLLNVSSKSEAVKYSCPTDAKAYQVVRDAQGRPDYANMVKGSYQAATLKVIPGASLYVIGYLTGHTASEIAQFNNLDENAILAQNQTLVVNPSKCQILGATSTLNNAQVTQRTQEEVKATPKTSVVDISQDKLNELNVKVPASAQQKSKEDTTLPESTKVVDESPVEVKPIAQLDPVVIDSKSTLIWPASGEVVEKFAAGDNSHQGISIAGKLGDRVIAAADGKVQYAGNRIAGYGNLIIIKSKNNITTVYGYNSKLFVKQGDTVRKGQLIALMGNPGSDRSKLYFSVRVNGKAVDPLKFLSKK